MTTNPIPGRCPGCNDPNTTFMQSIHSNGLFNQMLKRGNFKRNNLFCNNCIAWAKGEIRKSQQQGTSSQQPPQPPQPPPEEPQYSPISEPCNSRDTPDPFKDILLDSMNDPMIVDADSTTVNRLTLPNSPLHLAMSPLNYVPYDDERSNESLFTRAAHLMAPLPSPIREAVDAWAMNDGGDGDDEDEGEERPEEKIDHIDL